MATITEAREWVASNGCSYACAIPSIRYGEEIAEHTRGVVVCNGPRIQVEGTNQRISDSSALCEFYGRDNSLCRIRSLEFR